MAPLDDGRNDGASDGATPINRRGWLRSSLLALAGLLSLIGLLFARRWGGRRSVGRTASSEEATEGGVMKRSEQQTLQPVAALLRPQEQHWVGDGFFVSTIFSPFHLDPQLLSPFVLMDHAAPRTFEASPTRRGVREHPHRGFETVTFAYAGEIEHRDSSGGGGTIGPGDVQWMTAASGVVHEEMHSAGFSALGGTFEMVQLWVNLPARLKMSAPRYQGIGRDTIVPFRLGDASGRLVAGRFAGAEGPAQTHTPITVFELQFDEAGQAAFELDPGSTTLITLLRGSLRAQGDRQLAPADLLVLDRKHPGQVLLEAERGARALVLNGAPLDEPIVAHGPFVMNTREEIVQAMHDYQSGKMGHLDPPG